MYILIVEDNTERIKWFEKEFSDHNLIIVKDSEKGKHYVRMKKFDVIFLDHDLGGRTMVVSEDENTGYQVAKILPGTVNKNTSVIVHSHNPVGADNIVNCLKKFTKVYKIPFGLFNKDILSG
jgi:CheY-like chemotaxis protein